jgi:AMP-binding enzyme
VDDAGQPIANSDSGELQICGPSVFAGYYDNAEANDGAFVDGWFRTGDLACRDNEGNFQITGRLKDLINRGGIKINPIDVEVLIDKHPKVLQSAIVPMPDEIMGEKACVFILPRDGESVTLQEICDWLQNNGREDEMAGAPRAHRRDAAHAHPQDHQGIAAPSPSWVGWAKARPSDISAHPASRAPCPRGDLGPTAWAKPAPGTTGDRSNAERSIGRTSGHFAHPTGYAYHHCRSPPAGIRRRPACAAIPCRPAISGSPQRTRSGAAA